MYFNYNTYYENEERQKELPNPDIKIEPIKVT